MPLTDKDRRIAYSIVRHLQTQVEKGHLEDDAAEGIIVAQQCLCEAYGVDPSVPDHRAKYEVKQTLEEMFEGLSSAPVPSSGANPPPPSAVAEGETVSEEAKEKAEAYKQQGNTHLKFSRFQEALECYTKAIDMDRSNATYFCNRAAAYIKVSEIQKALDDCKKAVSLNPSYARAYGRMGYAYSLLEKAAESRDCFRKAIELDPGNENYKSNLETVEQQLKSETQPPQPGAEGGASQGATGGEQPQAPPGGIPGLGNLAGMMQNPAFMNMASSLMSNPAFQNFAGRMMSQGNVPDPSNIAGMMPNMFQVAQDMQRTDPEGFENLRQQASQFAPGAEQGGGATPQQPPKPDDKKQSGQ